jgi:hypothetical protein
MEPALVALLFADHIITENNGKKGIIGTFNRFTAPSFPVVFPPWAIYAAVTNLHGKHDFALTLIHTDTNQVIIPINGQFDVHSQNDVVELIFNIGNAHFHREGKYSLTFHIDGEIIGSRALFVDTMQQGGVA